MATATLNAILLQIAQSENIETPKIATNESPNKGYLANVNTITLKDPTSGKQLNLFVKKMPDEVANDFRFLYKNEAEFYSEIFPSFKDIIPQGSNNIELPLVPKTYYSQDEMIIMEDLSENGFKIWNPLNQPLDTNHIRAVLVAYGKFHAFSFALKHQNPEKFNSMGLKFEWFLTEHERLMDIGYYKSLTEKLAAAFDPDTEAVYYEAVACFLCQGQLDYLKQVHDLNATDVFLHGDNWTHNFMFRYDDLANTRINDVCILDFQLSRKSTPTADLSYFLTTCGCTEEVFDSIWDYLKVYHDSLQENLKKLNCPDCYSWETLKDEWQKYSLKGMLMAAIVGKMMIADKDELEANRHRPLPMQFDFVSRNEHLYHERMRLIIKYFYDSGIFSQWI